MEDGVPTARTGVMVLVKLSQKRANLWAYNAIREMDAVPALTFRIKSNTGPIFGA